MKHLALLICILIGTPASASAATLYRWTDASGTVRYGHQPPSGVEAEPAEEERRELYEKAPPIACRDLAERHLAMIDREIQRVEALKTGLGPEYELTPAARQELVLDLLAHRAALVTGRAASEFRAPTFDEAQRKQYRLQSDNVKMQNELKSRDAALDAQANQLNRARREADFARRMYRPWGPGFYMGPPGALPYIHP